MTKAVRVHKVGGPEALVYEPVDVPAPGPGEVHIRQHAVGLNFIDVYYRTGLYKAPGLPFIAGNEAAGEVLSVGPGVTNFHPGDRVAYYFNLGGYASERNIPSDKLVKLPDHITYEQGAVLMLKGLTVWYLLHKTFKVEPHHRVLIHAAAGGIGFFASPGGGGGRAPPTRHPRAPGRAAPSGPDPCRGRRHRLARMPVGEGARRPRHRHRRLQGEGRPRARQRLRPWHTLQRRGVRGARQANQPQRALRRRLRWRRQDHISGFAILPQAARHVREFR